MYRLLPCGVFCSHGHAGNDTTGHTQGCGYPNTDNDNFQALYKARNTMATQRTGIADIPVELLLDNILPFCEAKDVLSLGCTNKLFSLVTTDDMLWKRKLAADYNFTGSETARTSGWKFIYQRLRNPRVFVWGCVIFSVLLCYEGFHSSVNAPLLTHPIVTIQREEQRPTWIAEVSKHDPLGCSFSGRTSPPRCSRGQPGSEWNVRMNSV